MNDYFEQSIGGEVTTAKKLTLILCWVSIVGLGIFAMFNVASIFAGESINWFALILSILSLAVGFFLYRGKDKLIKEYDYLITDDMLEISVIYSGKRRKLCARIDLNNIERCGPASGNAFERIRLSPGVKLFDWTLGAEKQIFVLYNEGATKHLVLLDLNEAMATRLRRSRKLQRGAWTDAEGKAY